MTSQHISPHTRNVAGLIGFGLAMIYIAAQIVLSGVTVAIPTLLERTGLSITDAGIVFAVIGVSQVLWCVTISVFAVVGVTRPDTPRVLAGIALGVGGSGLVIGVASLVLPGVVGTLLSTS